MVVRALVFDVDGTLADTERDGHRIAFNLAFRDAGHPWHWDEADYGRRLQIAGGRERLLAFLAEVMPETDAHDATREALAHSLHASKTRHYVKLVEAGGIRLRPGIARLIEQAREAGLTLAIATTTSRANVDALLTSAMGPDAERMFACIACAEDAPRKKPDPQVYQFVVDALGLAPEACVAVEDSTNGVRAARAAGLPVLVYRNDYTGDQDFPGAFAVVDTLDDFDLGQLSTLATADLAATGATVGGHRPCTSARRLRR